MSGETRLRAEYCGATGRLAVQVALSIPLPVLSSHRMLALLTTSLTPYSLTMLQRRLALLRGALAVTGVICSLGFYPLIRFWHAGWGWGTTPSDLMPMMVGLYFVLGVFLIIASRDPLRHRSLIWFTVWSSAVHAAIMAVQTIGNPMEHGHWIGDIPALLIVAVALGVLLPSKKLVAREGLQATIHQRSTL